MNSSEPSFAFKEVPETGVIYVTNKAQERGFHYASDEWVNLGQGAPETDTIPGQSDVDIDFSIHADQHEYAPVAGLRALRESVANYYNELYRTESSSKYTYENVCICSGGRLALTRIAASLGSINIGHLIPDYTAYEELLNSFQLFHPMPILLDPTDEFRVRASQLESEILGRGLGALLLSNPTNPTGAHAIDSELERITALAAKHACCMIFDEFYSHYSYESNNETTSNLVSAAEFVTDVNKDPVLVIDGLTKNWRKPGWRISWTLGPKSIIQKLASAGSYLDGGAPHPLQQVACDFLDPETIKSNALALQNHFREKRDYVYQELTSMGIHIPVKPSGAFYCFGDLSNLRESIADGVSLFEKGLEEKIITVPGEFFDVNPGKRRFRDSRYTKYARFSFGPSMDKLEIGMQRLRNIIQSS